MRKEVVAEIKGGAELLRFACKRCWPLGMVLIAVFFAFVVFAFVFFTFVLFTFVCFALGMLLGQAVIAVTKEHIHLLYKPIAKVKRTS